MSNTQPVRPDEVAKYGEHGLNLTADANARLIAAAPELLAAANAALGLSAIWKDEVLSLTSIEAWDEARIKLRAAITKATA